VIHRLDNGVRVVTLPSDALATATVAVFVRSGSAHESKLINGISHVVEHMLFKGTATRDARRINLDAERLGAEVNAHTDRDHTAFYMRGLPQHAPDFAHMLGDLIAAATFPEDELVRERDVLLQELAEEEDDPVSEAFRLYDAACWGAHPAAMPVIGTRARLERLSRDDLLRYAHLHYRGGNIVVGAAGAFDDAAFVRACEAAFGFLLPGENSLIDLATYVGGVKTRVDTGSSQAHAVIGGPIAPRRGTSPLDEAAAQLAAAVLGEGMSSPLLYELRERRALAYQASASADVFEMGGQLTIDVSMAPERLVECLEATLQLLRAHAEHINPTELTRARRQLTVRHLRAQEKPLRLIEDAALDLFAHQQVRHAGERQAAIDEVSPAAVKAIFESLLNAGLSIALTGRLPRAAGSKAREMLDAVTRA
jgi:predicted Zn-dependent peptidase